MFINENLDKSTQMCYTVDSIIYGGDSMTVADIVKEIIKKSDLQQAQVARLMGWTPQNLSNRLGRNTLYAEDFVKLLDVMGYNMIVVEKETEEEVKTRKRGKAPRIQMMVNGVKYDTYKADALGVLSFAENLYQELYKTDEGEYFLVQVAEFDGGVNSITPVTQEVAYELLYNMPKSE